jgi:hypothetical protein
MDRCRQGIGSVIADRHGAAWLCLQGLTILQLSAGRLTAAQPEVAAQGSTFAQ